MLVSGVQEKDYSMYIYIYTHRERKYVCVCVCVCVCIYIEREKICVSVYILFQVLFHCMYYRLSSIVPCAIQYMHAKSL